MQNSKSGSRFSRFSWDEAHQHVIGVNYDSLVAVLVEASKAQQMK